MRVAASEFLLKNDVQHLPVNPFSIAAKNGWEVYTYPRFSAIIGKSVSYLVTHYDEKGFVFFSKKKQAFIICYNPAFPADMVRWTLFHEMGHISLRHITAETPLMCRNGSDKPFLEAEAQAFARGVLCPPVLLRDCEIEDTAELIEFSGIPKEEAEVLSRYINGNYEYEVLPLEKQVEKQFSAFIVDYKKNDCRLTKTINKKTLIPQRDKRRQATVFSCRKGKYINANIKRILRYYNLYVSGSRRAA